jgi:hypothetical protein
MPAGLPLFPWLRDEILQQLDLGKYVPPVSRDESLTPQQRVAEGLAPEPFMLALRRGGMEVVAWLSAVLSGGSPNAAHVALARLAKAGARVWTVNFDTLIEQAAGAALPVSAWPAEPAEDARLLKPHGTLAGRLIVDSEDVLRGLADAWRARLQADVRDRTIVFVGYSGRDLDFQPIWDDVLHDAVQVLWFDMPDDDEQERKRVLLRQVSSAGRLSFPHRPPVWPGAPPNPSWDFVLWCRDQGLVAVEDALVAGLHDKRPPVQYSPLQGNIRFGRVAVQHVLGDVAAARRSYLGILARGPDRRRAASELTATTVSHGRRVVGGTLALGLLLPPVGRARPVRGWARRKRATILSNVGRHTAVLRATRRVSDDDVSTLWVLRAAALRMTGSLDDAAATAERAMRQALAELHPIRVAHAAFQRGLSLVWAYRLAEARVHLDDRQRPYAALASTRWVAWADFTDAGLAIHHGDVRRALRFIDAGSARFQAEGLLDGEIDMQTIRLTALRLAGDDPAYLQQRRDLDKLMDPSHRQGIRYARGHRFTSEAIALEDAEFARIHHNDPHTAEQRYQFVARSRYPVHAALAHLGLATVQAQRRQYPAHAHRALSLGQIVNARLVIQKAEQLLTSPDDQPPPAEMFFP